MAVTSTTADLLARGVGENISHLELTGYRVGWLLFPVNHGEPVFREGPVVESQVRPGGQFVVTPQGLSLTLRADYDMVVMFISEAKLGDGTDWKADVPDISATYQKKMQTKYRTMIDTARANLDKK